jgi:hypothetical protein
VVKLTLFSLLKLSMIVMMLVLGLNVPAIAATTPDDLQSFVIQAADSLDLPLFPFTNSATAAQAKGEDVDSPPQTYVEPLNILRQSPQTQPSEQTTEPNPSKP